VTHKGFQQTSRPADNARKKRKGPGNRYARPRLRRGRMTVWCYAPVLFTPGVHFATPSSTPTHSIERIAGRGHLSFSNPPVASDPTRYNRAVPRLGYFVHEFPNALIWDRNCPPEWSIVFPFTIIIAESMKHAVIAWSVRSNLQFFLRWPYLPDLAY